MNVMQKAILECEQEWSQNRKLVELKGKDVRHRIPKGLPYFFVRFNWKDGFAHVIEDEQLFPKDFAQVRASLTFSCFRIILPNDLISSWYFIFFLG